MIDRLRSWPWPTGNRLATVISATPLGACFNHTQLAKSPLRTWVSPKGRIVVIGDAAHPFLPYTGQGGNQAIEDAAVIAICLERAGPGAVPLALRVFEKLRYVLFYSFLLARIRALTLLCRIAFQTQTGLTDPSWLHRSERCLSQC